MAAHLVLASASAYRRQLLERLRIPFDVSAAGVDEERYTADDPAELALTLAAAKAQEVASQLRTGLVVGSDQVASLGRLRLGKPGNARRAVEQLQQCSGQAVDFHTAVVLRDVGAGRRWEHVDRTRVRFRQLHSREIERYVALEQPYDCAGAFKAEGLGVALFEAIDSQDPTALIGLPLIWLCQALREAGADPLQAGAS